MEQLTNPYCSDKDLRDGMRLQVFERFLHLGAPPTLLNQLKKYDGNAMFWKKCFEDLGLEEAPVQRWERIDAAIERINEQPLSHRLKI